MLAETCTICDRPCIPVADHDEPVCIDCDNAVVLVLTRAVATKTCLDCHHANRRHDDGLCLVAGCDCGLVVMRRPVAVRLDPPKPKRRSTRCPECRISGWANLDHHREIRHGVRRAS